MSSKSTIFNILNIKKGEGTIIMLPVIYSFFAGAALAFFVTSATSLFLSSFEREMLPLAFIAAGIMVWLSGLLFSRYQKRIKFTKILTGSILFLLLSVLLFLFFYISTTSIIAIFLLYAWIRVFSYIHAITFWGLAGRLFNLRQGKRVFGLITGGEVFASILSFFSVPFLLKIIDTEDLLFISGATLLIAFLILLFIVKKYNLKLTEIKPRIKQETTERKKKTGFFSSRYYKLFFLIAFLPIFAQFFVDFIFQAQAKIEFPVRESLTAFVGLFFGLSAVVEFILKTFISGRLMNKYGMKLGLLAFPVMLAFSFVLASVFGLFYGAVTLFFSFVSLGRLFTRAVRTSFNDPATQILYQPLPPEERIEFQNKVESGPKAYASIAAGIILFAFTKISGLSLVYFSIFLLVFIVIWYKSGIDIYKEYKQILQSVLMQKSKKLKKSVNQEIFELIKTKAETINEKSKNILEHLCKAVFPYRKNLIFATEKKPAKKLKIREVIDLANSENYKDREKAAELFADYNIYKTEIFLTKLLNDVNFDVRTAAILTAGKLREPELFNYLFANLRINEYHDATFSAIINIGKTIVPGLSNFFYKIEHIPDIQLSVIKMIEIIGGDNAIDFLQSNISYTNKVISNRIIKALSNLSYQAKRADLSNLSVKLEEGIENYVYASGCLFDFIDINEEEDIKRAIRHEKSDKKNKIFTILSILYDPKAIELIRTNLESEDPDSRGFALEIADTVVSELHKDLLFPVFENLSDYEIINKYKYVFPQEKLSVKDRLIDIINSENSVTGIYTKTIAVNLLRNYESDDIYPILKTNIIHPNILIRETSAVTLFYKDPVMFDKQTNILKNKIKGLTELTNRIKIKKDRQSLLILEKLKLLRSLYLFSDLGYLKLTKLAVNSEELVIKPGESLILDKNEKNYIFICISGLLINKNNNKKIESGEIISLYSYKDDNIKYTYLAEEPTLILKGKIYLLNNLFAENIEFASKLTEKIT
ncbi:MAG: hypothetical protein K8R54_02800 [Bacteroidales bacterium]|nr:hypothetical protein [Bacteroidales bacterium]